MNFFSACGNVQQTLLILLLLATAVLQLFLAIEDVAGGRYLLTVFDSVLLTAELLYVKTLFEMRTQTAVWMTLRPELFYCGLRKQGCLSMP